MEILQKNDINVSNCLKEFKDIKKPSAIEDIYTIIFIGIIPFMVILYLIIHLLIYRIILSINLLDISTILTQNISLLLISFIIILISWNIEYKLDKDIKIKKEPYEFIRNYQQFRFRLKIIGSFVSTNLIYVILISTSQIWNLKTLNSSENSEFILKFIIFVSIFILVIISLEVISIINDWKSFADKTQQIINRKWKDNFPHLLIITSDGHQIDGILNDVFNSHYITLKNGKKNKITLWESINTIEFDDID